MGALSGNGKWASAPHDGVARAIRAFTVPVLVLVFAAVTLVVGGGTDAKADPSQKVIFADNFTGPLDSGWSVQQPATVVISSGKLVLTGTGPQDRVQRPLVDATLDQTVSMDFDSNDLPSGLVAVAGRIQGSGSGYAYYSARLVDTTTTRIAVYFSDGSKNTAIASTAKESASQFKAGRSYRMSLSIVGANPSTVTATLSEVGTSSVVQVLSVTDSDGPQLPGTAGLFSATGGQTSYVEAFQYATDDDPLGKSEIAYKDPRLFYSPYNWYDTGKEMQTNAGGAYLKIAFSGAYLGLAVDLSGLQDVDPTTVVLRGYIDGSPVPIQRTLADATNNELPVAFLPNSGDHFAEVFLSQTNTGGRWAGGAPNSVRITGFLLASDGGALSLSATPLAPFADSVLFYGDSVTEGYSVTGGSEFSYAADLADQLGVEYSQLGYRQIGWLASSKDGDVPGFAASDGTWSNYFEGASRLSNGRYAGVELKAIFVNLGINDMLVGMNADDVESAVSGWIGDARSASSPDTDIYLILPFSCKANQMAPYCDAISAAYHGYRDAYAADLHVFLIDLGDPGWQIMSSTTYSGDTYHPNSLGAAQLAGLLKSALVPVAANNLKVLVDGQSGVRLSWDVQAGTADDLGHACGGFSIEYQLAGSAAWQTAESVPCKAGDARIDGLADNSTYYFRLSPISSLLPSSSPNVPVETICLGSCGDHSVRGLFVVGAFLVVLVALALIAVHRVTQQRRRRVSH